MVICYGGPRTLIQPGNSVLIGQRVEKIVIGGRGMFGSVISKDHLVLLRRMNGREGNRGWRSLVLYCSKHTAPCTNQFLEKKMCFFNSSLVDGS